MLKGKFVQVADPALALLLFLLALNLAILHLKKNQSH